MKYEVKALFGRMVVEDDNITYRNLWGKKRCFQFSDIVFIGVRNRGYVVRFADFIIEVERRRTRDYLRFLDDAASHGVEIDEKA